MTKPRTPALLAGNGRKFWRELTKKYDFRPDELRILQDCCAEIDLIDDLDAAQRGAERIVKGSMGQQVINPLISELRQHRATLASLLGRLNLPDEATDSVPRSVQARDAAHARWRGRP
jgi:hypothetical protein